MRAGTNFEQAFGLPHLEVVTAERERGREEVSRRVDPDEPVARLRAELADSQLHRVGRRTARE